MTPTADQAVCPYRGTARYDAGDAGWFFGRDRLVEQLVSRLSDRITLVVGGPARCGKSSVVRAGVLPALAGGALPGSEARRRSVFTPGPNPLDSLWAALGELTGGTPLPDIFSLEEAPGSLAARVVETGVLVVDQFEELFTASSDPAERGAFLSVLEALAAGEPAGFRLILCVDSGFYGSCAAYPWLASVISDNHFLVGPMTRDELQEAIEGPARRAGLRLEEGLAERIVDDTGGSVELLSGAMAQIWSSRKGRILTLEGYESFKRGAVPAPTRREHPVATRRSTVGSATAASVPPREALHPPGPRSGPNRGSEGPTTLPILAALVILAVLASVALGILLTQMAH